MKPATIAWIGTSAVGAVLAALGKVHADTTLALGGALVGLLALASAGIEYLQRRGADP